MTATVDDADLQLIREWFNSVEDLSPGYLEPADYALAERLGIGPQAQRAKRAAARALLATTGSNGE